MHKHRSSDDAFDAPLSRLEQFAYEPDLDSDEIDDRADPFEILAAREEAEGRPLVHSHRNFRRN